MRRLFLAAVAMLVLIGGAPGAEKDVPGERTAGDSTKLATTPPCAVIVPLGGTVRLQMKTKRAIKAVVNPKENVINIRHVAGDPTTILITGQQPDITTIELTDENDVKESCEAIVQMDVEYLRTLLRRTVPSANITPIPASNSTVILTGTVAQAGDMDVILRVTQSIGGIQVINALKVGGVRQVQIDATIVSSKGISLSALLPRPPGVCFLDSSGEACHLLQGAITVLKMLGLVKIIAEPSLVTLSGRPATFLVGGEQAVPVVGPDGATGVQFEPVGTQITFLPIVLGDGMIYLEVSPSITELDAVIGGVKIPGDVTPGRRRTSVNTTVQHEPGQTMVLSCPGSQVSSPTAFSLPLLRDVPVLNALFGIPGTTSEKFVILVTPHLLDSK
jgi:pilus assembly protein CpaC